MSQVEFWFEFGSTYSYPAALRVEEIARSAGVTLAWRPFLLGPIFKAQGWNDSPFNLYPAKGRYMWRDLERLCGALGVPFRRPSRFPRNGLLAARLACWFSEEAWLPEFVRRVYAANFANDRDISDATVIGSIVGALGQPASVLAAAGSAEAKAKLRAETERAQNLGIFGAPAFVVDSELFWGNDRLEAAIAWAHRRDHRAPVERPLWEMAGGPDALRAVLRDFYATVFSDLMIGFLFKGADQTRLVERELELTLRALGADVPYTGRPLRAVHAGHPIFGGQFMRRRKLLADAIERHGLPTPVREAWLAHTDALRSEVTHDQADECDDRGAAARLRREPRG